MCSVLIIGYGVIGHNLEKELSALKPEVYDKYTREGENIPWRRYKLAFICVPTPYVGKANSCDITEVKAAIAEHDADLYVIKSAILPGTTDKLRMDTGKRIIYSPEYCGDTVHSRNYDFDFTIFGGDRVDCLKAIQILQRCYDGRHKFRMTDAKTAELVKYMENAFLATKVSFCCQFWEIAKKIGADYPELRELFLLDPRVNPSHTFVDDERPFWDSNCLNKDVAAITDAHDAAFLKSVIAYNWQNRLIYGVGGG